MACAFTFRERWLTASGDQGNCLCYHHPVVFGMMRALVLSVPISVSILNRGNNVAARRRLVEQRRHERIPLAIPMFVRGTDEQGAEFLEFATTLNISAAGALLAIHRYLPRLSTISLEIPSAPLPTRPVLPKAVRRLRGRLVRISTVDSFQLWGLKFTSSLGPKKRIARKPASSR